MRKPDLTDVILISSMALLFAIGYFFGKGGEQKTISYTMSSGTYYGGVVVGWFAAILIIYPYLSELVKWLVKGR